MKRYLIIWLISCQAQAFGWKFNLLPLKATLPVWTWTISANKPAIGGSGFYYIYLKLLNGNIVNSHSCANAWTITATGEKTPVGETCPYYMDGTPGTIGGCFTQGNVVNYSCYHD